MNGEEQLQWFALRVTYCRELKVRQALEEKGIRTFIPMRSLREEKDGKIIRRHVPAVNNLLFARSDQQTLYEHIRSEGEASMTRFMWDRSTRRPITVPDKQMEDFIRVCSSGTDDTVFLSELSEKMRGGTRVRVIFGPLAGVEGRVVRIRKSRRLLVELSGLLSVASAFIPLEFLEPMPEDDPPAKD